MKWFTYLSLRRQINWLLGYQISAGPSLMKLEQLEYFLALYDEHNFSRAARRCGIKQPSLTQAIKRLEADLGGPLFERKGRTTIPTELGKTLQPIIVTLVLAAEEVRQQAAQFLRDGSLPRSILHVNSRQDSNAPKSRTPPDPRLQVPPVRHMVGR